ncbi:hypothetical protein J7J18_07055 [bacterium]|nr:hypothetical protein [bacterium]
MNYFRTSFFHKIRNKLFRIYLNGSGEEGVFITKGGRRIFLKLKSKGARVNEQRVKYWMDRIDEVGLYKLVKDRNFKTFLGNTGKYVHPLFSELYRTWPNKQDKLWYRKLIENWHWNRSRARDTLQKLVSGELKNPFWDEVSALNRALLLKESKELPRITLYRGVWVSTPYSPTYAHHMIQFFADLKEMQLNPQKYILKDFPFASFSTLQSQAQKFGMVDHAKIPVSRIVGHYRIGFGSTREKEFIVRTSYRRVPELITRASSSLKSAKKWPDIQYSPLPETATRVYRFNREVFSEVPFRRNFAFREIRLVTHAGDTDYVAGSHRIHYVTLQFNSAFYDRTKTFLESMQVLNREWVFYVKNRDDALELYSTFCDQLTRGRSRDLVSNIPKVIDRVTKNYDLEWYFAIPTTPKSLLTSPFSTTKDTTHAFYFASRDILKPF